MPTIPLRLLPIAVSLVSPDLHLIFNFGGMDKKTLGGRQKMVFTPKIPSSDEMLDAVAAGIAEKDGKESSATPTPSCPAAGKTPVPEEDAAEFTEEDLNEEWHPYTLHPEALRQAQPRHCALNLVPGEGDYLLQLPKIKPAAGKAGRFITGKIRVYDTGEAFLELDGELQTKLAHHSLARPPITLRLSPGEAQDFPAVAMKMHGPGHVLTEDYQIRSKLVGHLDM